MFVFFFVYRKWWFNLLPMRVSFSLLQKSFAKLFRESPFVQLGDFNGRLVVGKVVHRVDKDLYIDFGSKFNTVCKTPTKDAE